jgi:hypothetical protein
VINDSFDVVAGPSKDEVENAPETIVSIDDEHKCGMNHKNLILLARKA